MLTYRRFNLKLSALNLIRSNLTFSVFLVACTVCNEYLYLRHFLIFIAGSASSSWIKTNGFQEFYYSGDAHDASVQEVIKYQFYELLTSSYIPPFFCQPSKCNKDDFTVSPGALGN